MGKASLTNWCPFLFTLRRFSGQFLELEEDSKVPPSTITGTFRRYCLGATRSYFLWKESTITPYFISRSRSNVRSCVPFTDQMKSPDEAVGGKIFFSFSFKNGND
ncbi:hypothetical protein TNCV_4431791 [Trichonephila clavipes]|nr:hypothetical protein TNCV_4431791 [Trichonephila clavipes]